MFTRLQQQIIDGVSLVDRAYNNDYSNFVTNSLNIFHLPMEMGAIFLLDDTLHIPIRGTEFKTLNDLITDMDVETEFLTKHIYQTLADYEFVSKLFGVHQGGWERYQDILRGGVFSAIDANKGDFKDIHIYGHSMGCWPATFMALDSHLKDFKINLTRYAPPKMAHPSFHEIADRLVSKMEGDGKNIVVNSFASQHDLVPDVPVGFEQIFPLTKLNFKVRRFDEEENHELLNFTEPLKEYFTNLNSSK